MGLDLLWGLSQKVPKSGDIITFSVWNKYYVGGYILVNLFYRSLMLIPVSEHIQTQSVCVHKTVSNHAYSQCVQTDFVYTRSRKSIKNAVEYLDFECVYGYLHN